MAFSTKDCEWKSVSLTILGRKFTGLRGFELTKSTEKEFVYASSDKPVDIASGNESCAISFTMLKYEVDLLNDAAQLAGYDDITKVPYDSMLAYIQFAPKGNASRRFIAVAGFEFTELKYSMTQGDKMMEVQLPGLAMGITTGFV